MAFLTIQPICCYTKETNTHHIRHNTESTVYTSEAYTFIQKFLSTIILVVQLCCVGILPRPGSFHNVHGPHYKWRGECVIKQSLGVLIQVIKVP